MNPLTRYFLSIVFLLLSLSGCFQPDTPVERVQDFIRESDKVPGYGREHPVINRILDIKSAALTLYSVPCGDHLSYSVLSDNSTGKMYLMEDADAAVRLRDHCMLEKQRYAQELKGLEQYLNEATKKVPLEVIDSILVYNYFLEARVKTVEELDRIMIEKAPSKEQKPSDHPGGCRHQFDSIRNRFAVRSDSILIYYYGKSSYPPLKIFDISSKKGNIRLEASWPTLPISEEN